MLTGDKIPFIKENLKMKDALIILNKKKLGCLVALIKNLTVGIITDGQIRRFNQKNIDLKSRIVKEVMTKKPISIEKNDLAAKALSLMNLKKITSLCVHQNKKRIKQ